MRKKNSKIITVLLVLSLFLVSCSAEKIPDIDPGNNNQTETKTYTVTFINYDGEVLETDKNVKEGSMPEYNSSEPKKENDENYRYEFNGWDKEFAPINCDTIFKAVYNNLPSIYTISFLNYDGTPLKIYENVKFNEFPVYLEELPVKKSDDEYEYEFDGWSPNLKKVNGDQEYIAQYVVKSKDNTLSRTPTKDHGQVFLYGEAHNDKGIKEEESRTRDYYYNELGYRDMLIEFHPIFANHFNYYVKYGDDNYIHNLFNKITDFAPMKTYSNLNFYKLIKKKYPETFFHGVDIASLYYDSNPIIKTYSDLGLITDLDYVYDCNKYSQFYYKNYMTEEGEIFREAKLAENILRIKSYLGNKNLVGFFGDAHISKDGGNFYFPHKPNMGNFLNRNLGFNYYAESLLPFKDGVNDYIVQELPIVHFDFSEYEMTYLGLQDISGWSDKYVLRKFYRIEKAYNKCLVFPLTGEVLPYNNYPIEVNEKEVFMIDYYDKKGNKTTRFYRSDPGVEYNGLPATAGFIP